MTQSLTDRQAIYLDTKFWLILRDTVLGTRVTEESQTLLVLLRQKVACGKGFCPISETTFMELLKQRDPRTILATSQLIDELSLGMSLIPFEQRAAMELRCFVHRFHPEPVPAPPPRTQWTRLSFVLGVMHPTKTPFDQTTELVLQKSFFDHMWDQSLAEMIEVLGASRPSLSLSFDSLADRLNLGNAQHVSELRSYKHTYELEAVGAADVFAETAAGIARDFIERATGKSQPKAGEPWGEQVRIWRNVVAKTLMHATERRSLPTLHVNTCMHASLRWQKLEKFEANDFPDFHPATAALVYCQMFLTERGLKARVTTKNASLDKIYACAVAASVPEAIDLLQSAACPKPRPA
ncbi:MAG: hypothetical protein ACOH1R_09875 [Luteimonas sp.]